MWSFLNFLEETYAVIADTIRHTGFFSASVHSHRSLLTAVFAFFFVLGFQNTTWLIVRRFIADPHLMPDRVPVRAGERILQTQQPLPQPRPRRWRDPDAALSAAALWARGKSLCYFHLDQRQD